MQTAAEPAPTIDPNAEYLTFAKVAALPYFDRPNVSTVYRWARTSGYPAVDGRRVFLRCVRIPGKGWCSTRADVDHFVEEINRPSEGMDPPAAANGKRAAKGAKMGDSPAAKLLDAAGI